MFPACLLAQQTARGRSYLREPYAFPLSSPTKKAARHVLMGRPFHLHFLKA